MKHSLQPVPHPEKWSKAYLIIVLWSLSLLNPSIVWDASITVLFDQVLRALLCNFSPICKADSDFFGLLTRPYITVSLTAEIHACGILHSYAPEFMLVFKQSENPHWYYPPWGLYTATFFVVWARKPFIHQMVGPSSVIEVLVWSLIWGAKGAVECWEANALRSNVGNCGNHLFRWSHEEAPLWF